MKVPYQLKVTKIDLVCLFELTWGEGRRLVAKLPYPDQIEERYQSWQLAYRHYYQSLSAQEKLRGHAVASGQIVAKTDWHSQLVQSEARLMSEFHRWLRSGELFEIREKLVHPYEPALRQSSTKYSDNNTPNAHSKGIDLLITCDAFYLDRLPWESWEISAEFGPSHPIRIARLPVNIRSASVAKPRQGKPRALVILGDDTGLNFEAEIAALKALKRLIDIKIEGWQPKKDIDILKQTICEKIQDPLGWDMVLFFGHSNEASIVGGQISIAPNTAISIKELLPYLKQAKANGLQFALFNSCKGLDIATSLIDIGLNQVVIMREPIANRVAQVFLIQFLQSLAQFDDVYTALQKTRCFLGAESNLTYPSAHLVPSLFCHSDAVLFRLYPVGLWATMRSLLPQKRWQIAAVSAIAGFSLFYPIMSQELMDLIRERPPSLQEYRKEYGQGLLEQRLRTQSIYRQLTHQFPQTAKRPPVLLIQIDQDSLRQDRIHYDKTNPIDRNYLSRIIEQLSEYKAPVVGIDYYLDRASENDDRFSQEIAQAVDQGMWIVFATLLENQNEVSVHPNLASLNSTMQGHAHTPQGYLRVPTDVDENTCQGRCPFNYLLALLQVAQETSLTSEVPLSSERTQDLRQDLLSNIQEHEQKTDVRDLYTLRLSLWTALSRLWKQRWLHPILDFSLPPEQAYTRVSASQLLENPEEILGKQYDSTQQVVIIAAGLYEEAGVGEHKDFIPMPPAVAYWYRQAQKLDMPSYFPRGEANAYSVHHFLKQHYVLPIPTFWLVGTSAIVGSGLAFLFSRWQLSQAKRFLSLLALSLAYGLISLQLYVSALVLLPWLLPMSVVWIYCLPQRTLQSSTSFHKGFSND